MFAPVDNLVCKTETGIPCQLPFQYNGNYYDTCINVDNGGVPWCYTNIEKKYWEICNSDLRHNNKRSPSHQVHKQFGGSR